MQVGTTPQHTLVFPIDVSSAKKIQITYSHKKCDVSEIILQKNIESLSVDSNKVTVFLSEQETFLFKDLKYVDIQARLLMLDDNVIATEPIRINVDKCLDDNLLSEDSSGGGKTP